jgi:tetratricopeptide (TPR) repeat protein/predicted aspartyl protease
VPVLAATVCLFAIAPAFAEKCSLGLMPPLEVTMRGMQPLVHAQINGKDALFIADSGAFISTVIPDAVSEFGMSLDRTYQNISVVGAGGAETAQVARAKTFTLLGRTFSNVDFVIAGRFFGPDVAGLLGQNVFRTADVEYDLANGVIHLAQPHDCKNTPLAYWAAAEHKEFSVLALDFASAHEPHTTGVAYLNGEKIRVMFDTGASVSMLTLAAAKRAGITPGSPGVTDAGVTFGVGHRVVQTWIATFSSFKIGDEEVQHARLRFGDVELSGKDMQIGADFFLSHRVYVASSQGKLDFTYNGGPVFDLRAAPKTESAAAAASGETAATPGPATAAAPAGADSPADAASFARRAMASATRHDYASALVDLTRACELAPNESNYYYERGRVYLESHQADLALADQNQAIKLKPDNGDALLARAWLNAQRRSAPDVIAADLEAADRAVPKDADSRMQIGSLYEYIEQPAAAVVQYSKWIDSHPGNGLLMPGALNARCWARALTGQALEQALSDCNAALHARPDTASFLDSRGLVYLRQGRYDKAIADYDAALHRQPKLPWSLYGLGLAKMHTGKTGEGQADVAAAKALEPNVGELAARYGITP